ncbi:hypothetical protein APSETT444_006111 [Aspergillus pseudonomiae]
MPKSDIIPFPYPLGLGTDICHIPRIRRILTRENSKYAERFSKRIFSGSERDAFQQRHDKVLRLKKDLDTAVCQTDEKSRQQDDYDRELWRLSSWVAGRFQHVDTVEGNDENRQPVTKRAAQLSISHDGEYAIATVLAAID